MGTAVKEKKVENATSTYEAENKSTKAKLKKCFIITPIGSETSKIRRQIDGVIDVCIEPILNEFGYEVYVAHKICETGSINNQVLKHIYEDHMVIANLTGLNPNVMYELAFRHSIMKPVIVIKDKDDNLELPFDVHGDRTIIYTNDIRGTDELKVQLRKFMAELKLDENADNPISRAVSDLENRKLLFKDELTDVSNVSNGNQQNLLQYIVKRLDKVDDSILSLKTRSNYNNSFLDLHKNLETKNENLYEYINIDEIESFTDFLAALKCFDLSLVAINKKDDWMTKGKMWAHIDKLKSKYVEIQNEFDESQRKEIENWISQIREAI